MTLDEVRSFADVARVSWLEAVERLERLDKEMEDTQKAIVLLDKRWSAYRTICQQLWAVDIGTINGDDEIPF